jgi:hypothetical protein
MIKHTKVYLAYSLVFCLGYLVACGNGQIGGSVIRNPTLEFTTLRMLSSSLHRPAIFPSGVGTQPVIATMFEPQAFPQVSISNPSQLGQSYESLCDTYGGLTPDSIHVSLGNSGLVSLNFLGGNICSSVLTSVGTDEGAIPKGFPVILAGSINTLVAYGTFVSGNRFRCIDATNINALPDNTFVRAYYDLARDAVILGSGTTQLQVTCSITIPAGDDVQHITVQWLKS